MSFLGIQSLVGPKKFNFMQILSTSLLISLGRGKIWGPIVLHRAKNTSDMLQMPRIR